MRREDLAQRIGQSAGTVRRLEENEAVLKWVDQVNALVRALPVSAEELLIAAGVQMNVPAATKLPKTLVDILLKLDPEALQTVEHAARAQLAYQRERRGKGE